MPAARHLIAVFLKFPEPGKVKSRLAAEIGPAAAAEIYLELVTTTFSALRETTAEIWVVHESLGHSEVELRQWLEACAPRQQYHLLAQHQGDLGDRLRHASAHLFASRPDSLTCIGIDCPALKSSHFSAAWELLNDGSDVVAGPADDGGYYLLATKAHHACLFHNIPWSSPATLSATLLAAKSACLRMATLESLPDIDTAEDLSSWKASCSLHPL